MLQDLVQAFRKASNAYARALALHFLARLFHLSCSLPQFLPRPMPPPHSNLVLQRDVMDCRRYNKEVRNIGSF